MIVGILELLLCHDNCEAVSHLDLVACRARLQLLSPFFSWPPWCRLCRFHQVKQPFEFPSLTCLLG